MDVFAERRRRLLEMLGGAAVFFSAPIAIRNNDTEHEYRQESDFFYLTGFDEPECALVLAPAHPKHPVALFVRPKDAEKEAWDGSRLGVDGATARLGVDVAHPIGELTEKLPKYLEGHGRLCYRLGRDRAADDKVIDAVAKTRARGRAAHAWPAEIVDPQALLHELRLVKSDGEIATMRRAAEITRDAHLAAMRLAAPGRWEYELEAALREVFRKNGAERVAYGPIVGSGPNATVLHYRKNRRRMEDGDLVLIDAGCEYDYYASDVTRTFPVNGRFSAAQRRIYEVVLEAQLAAIEASRPGATIDGVHDVAVRVIAEGLVRLGLLRGGVDEAIEKQSYKRFYMHRTSHWLGMDVHDVGAYYVGGRARPLGPGMVLTVEPGIYVRADDDSVAEEYRGIGVRIEDDVLVTPEGQRVLTADIPKRADEVERACRNQ